MILGLAAAVVQRARSAAFIFCQYILTGSFIKLGQSGIMFQIFDTQMLEKSLDASSLRQQVIANNIANLNTPGYQAQSVTFESELREALEDGSEREVRPRVVAQAFPANVHNEMASLAKNQILYNALSNKISGMFGALKWIIENAAR